MRDSNNVSKNAKAKLWRAIYDILWHLDDDDRADVAGATSEVLKLITIQSMSGMRGDANEGLKLMRDINNAARQAEVGES